MYNNPTYFNNPYYFQNQGMQNLAKRGIFSGLFSNTKFNWSNILNNTQKTLNVINQAIPVYYQIKPICTNAKTMLRMVNALKDNDNTNNNNNIQSNNTANKKNTSEGPVFFI